MFFHSNRSLTLASRGLATASRMPASVSSVCQLLALAVLLVLASHSPSLAVSASPHAIQARQPDGTEIVLHIRGNEHFHWQEDANGYTVLRERGRYVYARRNADGHLAPTTWEVGKANPRAEGLQRRVLPASHIIDALRASGPGGTEAPSAAPPETISPSGDIKNLVVMIRFANHQTRSLPSSTDMDTLFNADAPHATLAPTGSVKMVYLENSYGQMSLNSTMSGWIDVSGTEAYYADGQSGLSAKIWEALQEALEALDATVDFRDFDTDGDGFIDSITFIHSGYGAEWGGTDAYGADYTDRIWSHRWAIQPAWASQEGIGVFNYHISPGVWGTSGSQIGRIGVIAHETGHFLGLPDLYDTGGDGNGIGSYGLMANSWGFDGSQLYPPHFSPWSKIRLGWLTPTLISAAGTYQVAAAETTPGVYQITEGYPEGEYLLIENRQPVGFDGDMPQGGLAIWHIDDNATSYDDQGYPGQAGWPENGRHYRVALLQADAQYEMERNIDRGDRYDIYHGGGVAEIGPGTVPGTDAYQGGIVYPTGHLVSGISASGMTMTFDFNVETLPSNPPLAPSELAVSSASHERIDLIWADNADNEGGFAVERKLASEGDSGWTVVASPGPDTTLYSDTGLASGTSYDYRVQAINTAGHSPYSNIASATTTVLQPPAAPGFLTAVGVSDSQIDLAWTDNAGNEDGFEIRRSDDGLTWSTLTTLGPNAASYSDTGLPGNTTFDYLVEAFNGDGTAASNVATGTTDPTPLPDNAIASGEQPVWGTPFGTYQDTWQAEGDQIVEEAISEGRKRNRFSRMEHVWQFDLVKGGASVSFHADLYHEAAGDGDAIDLYYKRANDPAYVYMFTAKTGSANTYQSRELPAETSGTVFIKAVDSDRSMGNTALDSLHVRHMYIHSAQEAVATAPTNVAASALSATEIGLTWADATAETHYRIDRQDGLGWATQGTAPSGAENFNAGGLQPDTTYTLRVCAVGAGSTEACSEPVTETTLPDGAADIQLSARGYKVKGLQKVELAWSGAVGGEVYLIRNGSQLGGPTQNDGSHVDHIDAKGSGTYEYKVCEQGLTLCSNISTVVF